MTGKEHRDHFGSGIDHRCGRDTDENHQRGDRHDRPGEHAVAVFKELGDGVNAAAQKFRQEDERHHHERDGGHPFVGGDRHAEPVGGLAGHADELFGGNVRRDQRKADQPPGKPTAGQEVIGGSSVVLAFWIPCFPARCRRRSPR